MERLLTGLKPSGELTIGSYLGSIKQMVEYQNEYETFMFVPDLHAITVSQNPEELKSRIRKNIALYIACGINPEKVTLYIQSENLYHANLSWILECNSYFGEMSRMTQFKDKHSKGENITTGLFTYPALMASDILLYDADLVPVGKDQKQHVELARNIAERFNSKYGETFKVPSGLIPKTGAKIKDLVDPSKKMSKSEENYKGTILLLDSEKDIRKKIMSAVTDSDNKIYFDEENKPGISNLLTIYSSFKGINIKESEKIFENSNYGTFKKEVADVVATKLLEIQEKYQNIINSDLIDKILDEGRDKTIKLAKEKYEIVRKKIGLGR